MPKTESKTAAARGITVWDGFRLGWGYFLAKGVYEIVEALANIGNTP